METTKIDKSIQSDIQNILKEKNKEMIVEECKINLNMVLLEYIQNELNDNHKKEEIFKSICEQFKQKLKDKNNNNK